MEHTLTRFCTCPPSAYGFLKRQVDYYALTRQSYEFSCCRLFPGCHPETAAVGFWREQGMYQLYFRPAVCYEGENPMLARFFCEPVHCFPGFDALTDGLRNLGRMAYSPPDLRREHSNHKNPPADFLKNPSGDWDSDGLARQVQRLGLEYGVRISRLDPDLSRALTVWKPSVHLLRQCLIPALIRAGTDPGRWDSWILTGTPAQLRLIPVTPFR